VTPSQSPRRPTRATAAGRAYLDLQNAARAQGRDTSELLQLYALEGFLGRLAASEFADRLALKGGVLLAAFDIRRPTRDVDVAAVGLDGDAVHMLQVVRAIARVNLDDGLLFDPAAASATVIREDDESGGVRVSLPCTLARARLPFHVDVNVGDPVWPTPRRIELPRLLGGSLTLLGYPLAMVFAEKIVTAVQRGQANTRWRDFADIYLLSGRHHQDGGQFAVAIGRVAEYRRADVRPLGLGLAGFAELVQPKWTAWRRRQRLDDRLPEDFPAVVARVMDFADPALDRLCPGSHVVSHSAAVDVSSEMYFRAGGHVLIIWSAVGPVGMRGERFVSPQR